MTTQDWQALKRLANIWLYTVRGPQEPRDHTVPWPLIWPRKERL